MKGSRAWTGSWTGTWDNPSAASASYAAARAIGAASAYEAWEHASCKRLADVQPGVTANEANTGRQAPRPLVIAGYFPRARGRRSPSKFAAQRIAQPTRAAFAQKWLKPQFRTRVTTGPVTVMSSPEVPSVTPIRVRPFRAASKSSQLPAAKVSPVLIPIAPG